MIKEPRILKFEDFQTFKTRVMSASHTYVVIENDKLIIRGALDGVFIAYIEIPKTGGVDDMLFIDSLKTIPQVTFVSNNLEEWEMPNILRSPSKDMELATEVTEE